MSDCHICGRMIVPVNQTVRYPSCECHIEMVKLKAELADAKKLAMHLICENQGLMHKIDMMQNIDHYPRSAP